MLLKPPTDRCLPQRDAAQRALRRENPNQLSSRDAQVYMGFLFNVATHDGAVDIAPMDDPAPSPTRPACDSVRPDTKRRNMAFET